MISAYLKLVGEKSGAIKGPVRDRGDDKKDGSIALLALEHGIVSARDPASGLATGKRQHRPITFTKAVDVTSPLFYQIVTTNELLPTVDFFFYGEAGASGLTAGRETMLYKISLKKASVSKVEFAGHTDATAQQNARFALTEAISMVYDSIQWEWTNPDVMASDMFNSGK
jgi:type VI secretion system secreted protein Hcp